MTDIWLEAILDKKHALYQLANRLNWQYFCGLETFVHQIPCHPTTLVKWRQRISEKGVENY